MLETACFLFDLTTFLFQRFRLEKKSSKRKRYYAFMVLFKGVVILFLRTVNLILEV